MRRSKCQLRRFPAVCLLPRPGPYIVKLLQRRGVTFFPSVRMSDLSNDLAAPSTIESTYPLAQILPPEIIVEIVLELFETQWDIAWTATSVCRAWRFAALNVTGRLWSRIRIAFGTIPSSLARRSLPSKRIETWLQRGGPTTPLYLDLRDNSPLISNAFSDALNTTGAMNRVVEMRLSIISREQWRMRTPAPNLRVLWLMGPVEKAASLVLLSAALQGLFGYPSFRRPSTSLRELHLQRVKVDRSPRVFLQHLTHLTLFNCTEANPAAAHSLLGGCSANLQVLSVQDCDFPIEGTLSGAQLPKLHSLAVNTSNYVWYDTAGWANQLSAPSLQVLSTNAPRLKNLSPSKYQYLKHLTVSLRIMGTGLQQEIKGLDRWLNSPGLLTITLILKYAVNDIHSTPAFASPRLFFGPTVERVIVRLPPGAAATAKMGCERLKGVWAEVGKELVIERWAVLEA
jgi:hypothetical protein